MASVNIGGFEFDHYPLDKGEKLHEPPKQHLYESLLMYLPGDQLDAVLTFFRTGTVNGKATDRLTIRPPFKIPCVYVQMYHNQKQLQTGRNYMAEEFNFMRRRSIDKHGYTYWEPKRYVKLEGEGAIFAKRHSMDDFLTWEPQDV